MLYKLVCCFMYDDWNCHSSCWHRVTHEMHSLNLIHAYPWATRKTVESDLSNPSLFVCAGVHSGKVVAMWNERRLHWNCSWLDLYSCWHDLGSTGHWMEYLVRRVFGSYIEIVFQALAFDGSKMAQAWYVCNWRPALCIPNGHDGISSIWLLSGVSSV